MKHRVILQLDADQLALLNHGLGLLYDAKPSIGNEDISNLRNVVGTALEICENRDKADEAERKLSQLSTRGAAQ